MAQNYDYIGPKSSRLWVDDIDGEGQITLHRSCDWLVIGECDANGRGFTSLAINPRKARMLAARLNELADEADAYAEMFTAPTAVEADRVRAELDAGNLVHLGTVTR